MGTRREPFDFKTRVTWSDEEMETLFQRMAAHPQGFRVGQRSAALLLEALRFYHSEHAASSREQSYRVDEWDHTGNRVTECLARSVNLSIGRAAYESAVKVRLRSRLTFRNGTHMIAERLPPEDEK
jgi:hypothetical protein